MGLKSFLVGKWEILELQKRWPGRLWQYLKTSVVLPIILHNSISILGFLLS